MENKNIVMLKRSFLAKVNPENAIYTNQVEEHDLSDYIIVDAVQKNKEWGGLSPMKLGPVTNYDGKVSKTFEEFYQCSKVYPHMDTNGMPNEYYYKWRDEMYERDLSTNSPKELRHPQYNAHIDPNKHYEHSDCVYAIYYDEMDGKVKTTNSYVLSRKKIYLSGYCKLVVKTPEFKKLKELVDSGKKIAILDFDAYNYYSNDVKTKAFEKYKKDCKKSGIAMISSLDDYLNINTMKDVMNCPFMLAGHGFVIKSLLQGDLEVVDDKIIDHAGLLA